MIYIRAKGAKYADESVSSFDSQCDNKRNGDYTVNRSQIVYVITSGALVVKRWAYLAFSWHLVSRIYATMTVIPNERGTHRIWLVLGLTRAKFPLAKVPNLILRRVGRVRTSAARGVDRRGRPVSARVRGGLVLARGRAQRGDVVAPVPRVARIARVRGRWWWWWW